MSIAHHSLIPSRINQEPIMILGEIDNGHECDRMNLHYC